MVGATASMCCFTPLFSSHVSPSLPVEVGVLGLSVSSHPDLLLCSLLPLPYPLISLQV